MLSGCSAPADTTTPTAWFTLLETRAGDTVVTAGHIKLRDGVRVRVDNSIPVSNLASSIPENN